MPSPSSRGNSPLAAPSLPVPVPLITPRYQRKTRTQNAMNLVLPNQEGNVEAAVSQSRLASVSPTATAGQDKSPVPSESSLSDSQPLVRDEEEETVPVAAAQPLSTSSSRHVNELLKARTAAALQIKHGECKYEEQVSFHTFEMFRHGKHQVQSRSVGYSSDGDLVLFREEYALISESEMQVDVAGSLVDGAVCLNPSARRPLSDAEAALGPKRLKASRFRKYPGVRCPKNRKLRNRLMNDHFATRMARKVFDAHFEHAELDGDLNDADQTRCAFPDLDDTVAKLVLHVDEDDERRHLEKRGVYSTPPLAPAAHPLGPNHGDVRFQQLNAKLRDELKNALGSEFLTQQIVDLESYFEQYIRDPPFDDAPMTFQFRDGYGRLICHGVAAYYCLNSRSLDGPDGSRVTVVSLPKRTSSTRVELPSCTLMQTLLRRAGRSPVLMGEPSPIMPPFSLDEPVVYSEKHVDAALHQSKGDLTATQKKKLRKTMKAMAEALAVEDTAEDATPPLHPQDLQARRQMTKKR